MKSAPIGFAIPWPEAQYRNGKKSNMKNHLIFIVAVAAALSFTACKEKTASEKAADSIKEAAEKTGAAMKDAAEKTGNAVKEGAEKVADKAKEATK